jgi:hypothetical protein
MKYLLLIYIDPDLAQALPAEEYDALMRGCLHHADTLQAQGTLLMSQRLQPVERARTLRTRATQARVTDGPFAETRELLEAVDAEDAMRIARQFPWSAYGSIEVRPVDDLDAERVRLGA